MTRCICTLLAVARMLALLDANLHNCDILVHSFATPHIQRQMSLHNVIFAFPFQDYRHRMSGIRSAAKMLTPHPYYINNSEYTSVSSQSVRYTNCLHPFFATTLTGQWRPQRSPLKIGDEPTECGRFSLDRHSRKIIERTHP